MQPIRVLLTRLGVMAAHPGAFGILIVYAVLWFVFDRSSFDWHAGATLIVWFMTLLIQRAEHRDTQALQAKLLGIAWRSLGRGTTVPALFFFRTRPRPRGKGRFRIQR